MSTDPTRLTPARYLHLVAADGERLASAAEGRLDLPVPTCPGWDVAEAVRHVGGVYHHKMACTVLGRPPGEDEWEHGPGTGEDLLSWYREALAALLAQLSTHDPGDPSATWYPADQTVGFWQRRMAHETAVHRVDVESASAVVTPVADDLAVDGVDEVLDLCLAFAIGADPEEDVSPLDGRTLAVRTGPHLWRVAVHAGDPAGQILLDRGSGHADATVTGEPSELMLWLWGRRPDSAVTFVGDRAVVAGFRELIARGTS